MIFNPYIHRLLRKSFSHFFLLTEPSPVEDTHGLLITPNHFSWWDGFFIDYVMRRYTTRRIHIMMLEEQLKRYWFFRKLGAYSINPRNPRAIAESIAYTREVLRNTEHFVVFYPQGEIRPYDERPVQLKPGIVKIVHAIGIPVVVAPVAFKIQYADRQKPDVFCRFGAPLEGKQVANDLETFTEAFRSNIAELDSASITRTYNVDLFA